MRLVPQVAMMDKSSPSNRKRNDLRNDLVTEGAWLWSSLSCTVCMLYSEIRTTAVLDSIMYKKPPALRRHD
jgi:hypothetical protein